MHHQQSAHLIHFGNQNLGCRRAEEFKIAPQVLFRILFLLVVICKFEYLLVIETKLIHIIGAKKSAIVSFMHYTVTRTFTNYQQPKLSPKWTNKNYIRQH